MANFCFLTKDTNLVIADRLPEDYFAEVEKAHPGALASQWIPMDRALWRIERYHDFLAARRSLLAAETNRRFDELRHGDPESLAETAPGIAEPVSASPGDITGEAEEREVEKLNDWLEAHDLPRGHVAFDHADQATGAQKAVFDLAWPEGLQPGLTGPAAVLLNATPDVLATASAAGYRCFTSSADFRAHVQAEILKLEDA